MRGIDGKFVKDWRKKQQQLAAVRNQRANEEALSRHAEESKKGGSR